VKVYLDEDLSPTIAKLLRQQGVDATSTIEVGNAQLDDRSQLAHATGEGRTIVTANVVDFIELAREGLDTNTEHAGIVLVPSSFRGDEFQAITDAICEIVKRYPDGLRGVVVIITRG